MDRACILRHDKLFGNDEDHTNIFFCKPTYIENEAELWDGMQLKE